MREGADAVMLSGETAHGRYPFRAIAVQASVALRTEQAMARTQYQQARPAAVLSMDCLCMLCCKTLADGSIPPYRPMPLTGNVALPW